MVFAFHHIIFSCVLLYLEVCCCSDYISPENNKIYFMPALAASILYNVDKHDPTKNTLSSFPSIRHVKQVLKSNFVEELQNKTTVYGSATDITIVTAFFDIGSFPKRSYSKWYHREMYIEWATVFRYIQNCVVVYTDSNEFYDKMLDIRRNLENKTIVRMIQKENAWPFKHLRKITEIFNSTSYPKFLPNTVYPLYSIVQHAKYYLLQITAEKGFFKTKYIMWLDIGLFRKRQSKALFYMSRPKGFDESKIAMTQVYRNKTFNECPEKIIKTNSVIVCGALVFGERLQMFKFAKQFKEAVEYFLKLNLTNTDQQIIYALFTEKAKRVLKPEVHLQMYQSNKSLDWFFLGYYMISEV